MKFLPHGRAWLLLLGAVVIGGWTTPALAELPPIENYTRRPAIEDVAISPSGKRLAVITFSSNGRKRLGVMDLDPVGDARIVGSFGDADVTDVQWVTDDRLVFSAFQRGAEIREGGAGVFAVNHDGSDERQLISWRYATGDIPGTAIASKVLPYGWYLHSVAGDGSSDVFVYRRVRDSVGDLKQIQLARLDTRTRELRNLSLGMPDYTQAIYLDTAREPRMVTAEHAGRTKLYWRAPGADAWKQIGDFDSLNPDEGFSPWHIEANGQVLVTTALRDTEALYRYDPVKGKLDAEPLIQVKGFDLDASPEVDGRTRRLMGFHFRADRPMSYWFDEGVARVQKGIDAALPAGRFNRIYCGECESTRFFVIRSSSDRQPGEYYLFDRKSSAIQLIGAARPWIDETKQARRTFHRYAARDGLAVPLFVTHPAGVALDKPLPTVVLVHGGPFARGTDLTWTSEAQFLASRGYRVLEPEFRGGTGFGTRHFKAGWKEWGHAMQNDLVDAVQWATKQGGVDPARVCIMGASYGGYAALMSPIAHPGVYRCAASFAGVTDPMLMYSVTWSDLSQAWLAYGLPVVMGDPGKDAARLAEASPLGRVAELKVPVLIAHGGADRRVPIVHARKFADAAKNAGVKLEQVEYLEEGHGFFNPANRTNYYERVERFFQSSIGARE